MFTVEIDIKFNKLLHLPAALLREAEREVRRNAEECRDGAKALAPVDTGKLRDSIDAQQEGPAAWVVGPHTDYDIYVELGTSKMAAQPYLTPAAEQQRRRFFADMTDIVERAASR